MSNWSRGWIAVKTGAAVMSFTLGFCGLLITGPVGWAAVPAYGAVVWGAVQAVDEVSSAAQVNDDQCYTPKTRK